MKKSKLELIKSGLLTNPLNPKSKDFKAFRKFLDSKVEELTAEQLQSIVLQGARVAMNDYLNSKVSKKNIVRVGEFLREVLGKLNVKQNRFAEYLGMKPSNLSKILSGERKISFEFSLILEQIFEIESSLWLRIQAKNREIQMSKRAVQSFRKFKLTDLISKRKKNAPSLALKNQKDR